MNEQMDEWMNAISKSIFNHRQALRPHRMCEVPAVVSWPSSSVAKVTRKTSCEKALVLSMICSCRQFHTVSMKSGSPPCDASSSPSGLHANHSLSVSPVSEPISASISQLMKETMNETIIELISDLLSERIRNPVDDLTNKLINVQKSKNQSRNQPRTYKGIGKKKKFI